MFSSGSEHAWEVAGAGVEDLSKLKEKQSTSCFQGLTVMAFGTNFCEKVMQIRFESTTNLG